MTYTEWAIFLSVAGIILIAAELFLPTHGLLGALGACAVIGALVFCFLINIWLGTAAFVGTTLATPFVFALAIRLMPKTLVGRRLVLPPINNPVPPMPVQIGQVGLTVSELRPMGICEFDGQRVEVLSEYGMIPPGQKVQVVNLHSRKPTVRAV